MANQLFQVSAASEEGFQLTLAVAMEGGLAVTRFPFSTEVTDPLDALPDHVWHITHIATGRCIGDYYWDGHSDAIKAMMGALEIHDWEAIDPLGHLKSVEKSRLISKVLDVLEKHNGLVHEDDEEEEEGSS